MITYEEFWRIIKALRENNDKLAKIAEALNCAEVFELSVCDEVAKLLSHIFKDEDGWIDYYLYERDFGRDWYDGCAQDADGTDIDLSTTRKLYEFLVSKIESF